MNRPVVYLCHPYHRGGVTSWMLAAALESAERGWETYFVTVAPVRPFISSGTKPSMVSLLQKYDKKINLIAPEVDHTFELGTEEYRSLIYMRAIISKVPGEAVIVVSDDDAVWRAAAMLADRYPMIGVLHSDDIKYYQLVSKYRTYVSTFVAVSKRVASKVNSLVDDIPVIPCGIEVEMYNNPRHDRKNSSLNIVWIGRVEEQQKRVSDIPLIASKLKEYNVEFTIHVIGAGPELSWLEAELVSKKLDGYVSLWGWKSVTEITDFLLKADVLLQTSNYEGMSVAVMEALAAGCGVVSTRVSGVEDYENTSIAEKCLFLYEIGDINMGANAVVKLLDIPSDVRKERARMFALKEFSIQTCIDRYAIVYNKSVVKNTLGSNLNIWIQVKSFILSNIRILKYQLIQLIRSKKTV